MPRRSKAEIVAERRAYAAYLQLFSNCPVPMLKLQEMLKLAESITIAGNDPRPEMVRFAKANDIPFNATGKSP